MRTLTMLDWELYKIAKEADLDPLLRKELIPDPSRTPFQPPRGERPTPYPSLNGGE